MRTFRVRALIAAVASVSILGASLASVQAQGRSESANAKRFAVVMDGPITIDGEGLHADLYSITGERIGMTLRSETCVSSDPPNPIAPPCDNPPVLQQDQFYYEDQVVVFELPGGTIRGALKGYEVFNSNPPANGGDRSATAVEDGEVTGGTGKYAGAHGQFSSRISDEFKFLEHFGLEAPVWFNHSVVLFDLR